MSTTNNNTATPPTIDELADAAYDQASALAVLLYSIFSNAGADHETIARELFEFGFEAGMMVGHEIGHICTESAEEDYTPPGYL